MTPVQLFELVLLLLALVIPLELAARRIGLPPAAALILGGMLMALLPPSPDAPWGQDVKLDPDLTLVLFLPPLLMSSAWFTVWRDFRANLGIILQLAVGAVIFTTLIVGVVAHAVVPGLPWAACFALGAIISPPDSVAAKAVLQRVRLPPRMMVLLEGESLVNDATGLVLFRFAVVAAMTGGFNAAEAAGSFVLVAGGGVLAGAGFGVVVMWLLARLRQVHMQIIASLLAAWASYIGGEAIGVSGVLCTVACGLLMGWRQHSRLGAATRMQAKAVWEIVVFVLESLVFILIGLSLRSILLRLGEGPVAVQYLAPAVACVVAAVVIARFVWIFPSVYFRRVLPHARRHLGTSTPIAVPLIMSWAGMRGVVSLAAALSLPEAMPGRDFILLATFAVILVTVLIQGATLAPLIRAMGLDRLPDAKSTTLDESQARAVLAQAQLDVIRRAVGDDGTPQHPRLLEQYEYRARATHRYVEANGSLAAARSAHFDMILALVAAGRVELLELHHKGEIHDSVLHALEHELDLEELGARRHSGEEEEA